MNQDDLTARLKLAFDGITDDIISDQELCIGCSDRLPGYPKTDSQPEEPQGCWRVENLQWHCKHITEQLKGNFR